MATVQTDRCVETKHMRVPLFDLLMGFSEAMDYIDPRITNHHKEVAYIALSLAKHYGLNQQEQEDIFVAACLHDVGALSCTVKERLETFQFELENAHKHAELGYILLNNFAHFCTVAELVKYHHLRWDEDKSEISPFISTGSQILHLADRIAVLRRKDEFILNQTEHICTTVQKYSGSVFNPELVEVFLELSGREYFWLDFTSKEIDSILSQTGVLDKRLLDIKELRKLARFFSYIIDFRSRFTATHSCGVAAVSRELAELVGFSEDSCELIQVAGCLHDLGKLALPTELLEKKELTRNDINIIKSHTYFTYRLLQRIRNFDVINKWASLHHERLDGRGYPFHLKAEDIPMGSRIMAVADVYTALTEDRPYRKGMSIKEAMDIINAMTGDKALDPEVVSVLEKNVDDIEAIRREIQMDVSRDYLRLSARRDAFVRQG